MDAQKAKLHVDTQRAKQREDARKTKPGISRKAKRESALIISDMYRTSPSPMSKDGTVHDTMCHLSVEDRTSFFQYQRDQCLASARSGCCTDLSFVSKTGEVVSAHQALLLPLSSHLKLLVQSNKSCGCVEDVHTLLLPDWDNKVIEAMVNLLYSGSVTVTGDILAELPKLMDELSLDISPDQLVTETVFPSRADTANNSTSGTSPIPIEEALAAENQMSTISTKKSGDTSYHTIQKPSWIHDLIIEKVETEGENEEQRRAIKKLRKVLDFLEKNDIQNKESFDAIKKPLNDLLTSLKYLPTNPSFSLFPMEIKSQILRYLCDTGSFVAASVCLEWKELFKKRLQQEVEHSNMLTEIKIGKHCSNLHSCEEDKCFMPEEILEASLILKLDIRLKICHPVTNVDSKLLAQSLTSVSEFSITEKCYCDQQAGNNGFKQMLTLNQMKMLFDTIAQNNEILKSVELDDLDMIHLDQDWLMNCLMKVNRLLLSDRSDRVNRLLLGDDLDDGQTPRFNAFRLIEKLNTSDTNLSEFYLEDLNCPPYFEDEDFANDLANALCRVKTIYLGSHFALHYAAVQQLVSNILTQHVELKNLSIFMSVMWHRHASTEDMKSVMVKLESFLFYGYFTSEQVEAARSIPDVYVDPGPRNFGIDEWLLFHGQGDETLIRKGIYIDKSQIRSSEFCLADIFFRK